MQITEMPLTGTIGAELSGCSLENDLSPALIKTLKQALARHQVVFLRDQHLTLAAQKALTAAFGLSSVFLGAAVLYALSATVVAVVVPARAEE